jgi:hypothetical protein
VFYVKLGRCSILQQEPFFFFFSREKKKKQKEKRPISLKERRGIWGWK